MKLLKTLHLSLVPLMVAMTAHVQAQTSHAILDYNDRFHPIQSSQGMVVSQEAVASEVGAQILRQGGNAVDAAVATGFALAVTFPQAGNIGGGGFMVIHLAEQNKTISIDYREMAPAAAHETMYQDSEGNVIKDMVRYSHAAAGVPGSVAGLHYALETYGTMSLKEVIKPAIELAKKGINVTTSLETSLRRKTEHFRTDPSSIDYFLKTDQQNYEAGDLWQQKDLAKTLTSIAKHGPDAFYKGDIADLIVAEMEANNGLITKQDLANYTVVERPVVRGTYKGYDIVSMPPPSSGGTHLIQMLNMIETAEIEPDGHNSAEYIHLLTNAMKFAYADRSEYLGDPDFIDIPVEKLISKTYAKTLATNFSDKAIPSSDIKPGAQLPPESPDTTHYNAWDKDGNVVAVTTTLNFSFGNGKSVDGAGFLLNNEMDDFSAKPGTANGYGLIGGRANAIEAGKRPLSSMTPTIIFKDGKPILATGSPGGSTIITAVLQSVLNTIEFDMNVAESSYAPRFHHQWLPDVLLYEEGFSKDTIKLLEAKGYTLKLMRAMGKIQAIRKVDSGLEGATDSRWPDGAAVAE